MGTGEACQLWLGIPSICTAERTESAGIERKRCTNLCGLCDLSDFEAASWGKGPVTNLTAERAASAGMERKRSTNLCGLCDLSGFEA